MKRIGTIVTLAIAIGAHIAMVPAAVAASNPIPLILSQGSAFSILGYWCGGIQEKSYATGFDSSTGYPVGDVYLQTTCNGSGRGGHSITHKAWATVEWDLTGATVAATALSAAPAVDPTFTDFDANGNEIYNSATLSHLQLAPGYTPAPRITSISATSGPASGGTSVTISGTGLTGATSVMFGNVEASYTVTNDNSIAAVTPPEGGGTVIVTVVTAGGPNAASPTYRFTFVPQPIVTKMSPNHGPVSGGTSITITGSGFTAVTSVMFDENAAAFTIDSDSQITVISPPGEGVDGARVSLTSLGGTSPNNPATQWNYVANAPPPAPSVTQIKPNHGPKAGGTTVTIDGKHFLPVTAVMFGKKPATQFAIVSDTAITAYSPAGSKTVNVRVADQAGTSKVTSKDRFTYRR